MNIHRLSRFLLIGLSIILALQANAQPLDTLALRAKADSLHKEALTHYLSADFRPALEMFREAARIRDDVLRERTVECSNSYNNLAGCLLYLGDVNQAISCFEKSKDIRREVLGTLNKDYMASLNNLGGCYLQINEWDKALEYYSEALEISREIDVEEDPAYATLLGNLGYCQLFKNDFGEAIRNFSRALEIRRDLFGEDHPSYAESLLSLAGYYWTIGDHVKSLSYSVDAARIFRETYGEITPHYAEVIMSIANNYYSLQDYDKAVETYEKALEINHELYGEKNPGRASLLSGLGITLSKRGDYDGELACLTEALEIRREVLGERDPDFARSVNILGSHYMDVKDSEKAIEYYTESKGLLKEAYGERSANYALALTCLAEAYHLAGDRDSTSIYYQDYLDIISEVVLKAFTYLPGNQRSFFWDQYSYKFTNLLPVFTRFLSDDKRFLRVSYDGALFSKGLLLNAETEMRQMILDSGDEEALTLYDRIQTERKTLDELYSMTVEERPMDADSLENVCEKLERELQEKSETFGDYTRNLSIGWKDVQAALGKRDIAIEFMEVPVSEDTTLYCALTLKPGYDAPRLVDLFDLKDLNTLKAKYAGRPDSEGLIYRDKELYNLVWKPLEDELKGVKNVYFGPSGELYQTAIEYADNGKGPISGRKNLFRLSSTRQLAVDRGEKELRRSAVFGGLKYGASEETLLADSRKYDRRGVPEDIYFNVDSLDIRGAGGGMMVADLPGTESEALEIDSLLRKVGLDNTLRIGEEGTEAAFKDLSGRRENIIHIATHGFYWNGSQGKNTAGRLGREVDGDFSVRMREDVSMTRSGLLFSGANNTLRGGERKEGVDDGILTAKEISQMDLRGTDLLALSACQTGVGEVSGEGVFGLQRGFKKAGVNTILMSLWEVDDEATCLLMTSFYKELAKGKSKSDALKAAQKAVKNHKGKDFSSPFYWASFILLDGD